MRDTLAAFQRALGQETHVLSARPELLWQQLANHLLDSPVDLAAELQRRERPDAPPWLRRTSRARASVAPIRTFAMNLGWLNACALSSDPELALAAGVEGHITVFDAATGRPRPTLEGHAKPVNAVDITADGRLAVSASDDGTLAVWDVRTTARVRSLKGHERAVQRCVFARGGALIVSAGSDGTVRRWDADTGAALDVIGGHRYPIAACVVTPDANVIASGDAGGCVRIWQDGTPPVTLPRFEPRISALAFVGEALAVGLEDGTLSLWSAAGDPLTPTRTFDGRISACIGTPGALFVAGEDERVRILDPRTLETRAEISAEAENMALSADAKRLLTASGFADARLWDLTAATAAADDSIAGAVHAFATSAEATAAACSDGTVRVLGAGGQEVLRGHAGTVADCRFGPDGSWLVSAGTDGTLRRWQDHGHTVLAECDSPLNAVALGGAWAVAVAMDGSVVIVGLDPAREPRLLTAHKAQAWSCAADPSGRFAVTTGYDGTARIWSAPDGDALATLDGPAPHVLCCDVNRAGAVVCGDGDGALRVWDPPEWRCRHVLSGHDGDVVTCAWTPDGAYVLSGGRDGVLRLWDARGGDLRSRGMGHFDRILACAIAADGRLCASTGTDSSLRVWKLPDLHEHAVMPLPGDGRCVAFHPSRAAISCGGMGFVSTFDMLPVPPAV